MNSDNRNSGKANLVRWRGREATAGANMPEVEMGI